MYEPTCPGTPASYSAADENTHQPSGKHIRHPKLTALVAGSDCGIAVALANEDQTGKKPESCVGAYPRNYAEEGRAQVRETPVGARRLAGIHIPGSL
jgi:hypothetical protein